MFNVFKQKDILSRNHISCFSRRGHENSHRCLYISVFSSSCKQTSEKHQSLRYITILMWDPWFTVTLGRSLLWMAGFRAIPYGHGSSLEVCPTPDTGSFLYKIGFLWWKFLNWSWIRAAMIGEFLMFYFLFI